MARLHRYRDYVDEDDTYVDDQSCDNCRNPVCPMNMPETAEEHFREYGTLSDYDRIEHEKTLSKVVNLRSEDAVTDGDELIWCIYWKGRNKRGY